MSLGNLWDSCFALRGLAQLWAWCLWMPNNVEYGGVEFTRQRAKQKAEEALEGA